MIRPTSVWVMDDQLSHRHPALLKAEAEVGREHLRVVLIESKSSLERLPYHKKRQVLILSAGRHFARELLARGYSVDLRSAKDSVVGLKAHVKEHKPSKMLTIQATEYAARRWQVDKMATDLKIPVEVLPNNLLLLGRFDPIPEPEPGKRYVMENFYRAIRKHFGILIEPDGSPTGGAWNFDAENRKPLRKTVKIPDRLRVLPDELTLQVMSEIARGNGVGDVHGFDDAVDLASSRASFEDFLKHRLPLFGAYEDAMSKEEGVLFHSKLSLQMNLGLLDPLEMAQAAEREYREGRAPLNSVEGFIRQIIGWREFMYWQYHRQMPALRDANAWNGTRPLPRMFWDAGTNMNCIKSVVTRLIETGYTHHIERLMILTNFATLAGLNPAAVADWFLTFYADSHEWVVYPNVIGMGMNADGGITATKPYISSASYIHRMSDFCSGCSLNRDERTGENACPFNMLYWNFLIKHETELRANPRLGPAVLGLGKISQQERLEIQSAASQFLDSLTYYGMA